MAFRPVGLHFCHQYLHASHRLSELLSNNKVLNALVISSAQYYASPKLSMGVNVGFSIDKNSTMGQSETHVSPRIAAWAAYYPSDKIVARLNYITWSISPLLGQLQSYGQFQDSLVYRGGNPWLKPSVNHNVSPDPVTVQKPHPQRRIHDPAQLHLRFCRRSIRPTPRQCRRPLRHLQLRKRKEGYPVGKHQFRKRIWQALGAFGRGITRAP